MNRDAGTFHIKTDRQAGKAKAAGRRSGMVIMGRLIGLVRPLWFVIVLAVLFGSAGYLCAIFLTILTAGALTGVWLPGSLETSVAVGTFYEGVSSGNVMSAGSVLLSVLPFLLGLAVLRGILHYAEQYCNHFIAFKLLAILRHKLFAALRRLCPAKLEGKDRGNLISVITSDIELLEVFYAHTISPIAIAVVTELVMVRFLAAFHPAAAMLAFAAYVTVGCFLPLWNGRRTAGAGMEYRNTFGDFNSFLLDSFRGLSETLQYGRGSSRRDQLLSRSVTLGQQQKCLNQMEGTQRALNGLLILFFSLAMLLLTAGLFRGGSLDFPGMVLCTVAMMGSFGPVTALSSLSNNLNQTLASGERVLAILEEEPVVEELPEAETPDREGRGTVPPERDGSQSTFWEKRGNIISAFDGADAKKVSFRYRKTGEKTAGNASMYGMEESACGMGASALPDKERERKGGGWILKDFDFRAEPGRITGIHGPSGCGKSTLLKLLMRFWDVDSGGVYISGEDVRSIPTAHLRAAEAYVTQETHLFHDTIAANIAIGRPGASLEEIHAAARKASVDDFIMSLPKGYDTEVGELGDTLSGGERQRIGIARAFLHDAPLLLLDEPTSNLDSLNEGIILKSLKESGSGKTIVLVSHRESTMRAADTVVEWKESGAGR